MGAEAAVSGQMQGRLIVSEVSSLVGGCSAVADVMTGQHDRLNALLCSTETCIPSLHLRGPQLRVDPRTSVSSPALAGCPRTGEGNQRLPLQSGGSF